MLADLLVMGGGAVAAAGMLWHWRRIETGDTPGDPVAEAPPELRTAVLVVCDPGQLTLMWPALRLGRWDVGYPNIISATYTSFGMTIWRVRVLYGHILLAGATGSGKGSVLWSIIVALGPAIKAGVVDLYLADPKGGAEFSKGENRLFVRFATDNITILAMLNEAVELMRERLARMGAAGLRKIVPSTDEPLILIIIDEAAALSSYAEREEQHEFRRLTGLLLSQGRAAAVSVIAALQDPSKETMPNRQLFPVRIGLRLDEPTQNAMVHGHGARDRGARCDEISDQTPGVGYVGQDGTSEFVRVRSYFVSDDDLDAIVDAYSPAPDITGPVEDYSGFDPDDLGDSDSDSGRAAA